MRRRGLLQSFNAAFEGMIHVLRTQRNMRIHVYFAVGVLVLSLLVDVTKIELVIILMLVTMVMVAELLNTAIEAAIDLMVEKHNPLAKIAKDVAAAAVLIAAGAAAIIGYLLIVDKINTSTFDVLQTIRRSPTHLTYISLLLVFLIAVGLKASRGRFSLQGGMPSIHAGIAAAGATAIAFLTANPLVMGISVILALLVIESRVEAGIHTAVEVAIGAALGAGLTLLVFQVYG